MEKRLALGTPPIRFSEFRKYENGWNGRQNVYALAATIRQKAVDEFETYAIYIRSNNRAESVALYALKIIWPGRTVRLDIQYDWTTRSYGRADDVSRPALWKRSCSFLRSSGRRIVARNAKSSFVVWPNTFRIPVKDASVRRGYFTRNRLSEVPATSRTAGIYVAPIPKRTAVRRRATCYGGGDVYGGGTRTQHRPSKRFPFSIQTRVIFEGVSVF